MPVTLEKILPETYNPLLEWLSPARSGRIELDENNTDWQKLTIQVFNQKKTAYAQLGLNSNNKAENLLLVIPMEDGFQFGEQLGRIGNFEIKEHEVKNIFFDNALLVVSWNKSELPSNHDALSEYEETPLFNGLQLLGITDSNEILEVWKFNEEYEPYQRLPNFLRPPVWQTYPNCISLRFELDKPGVFLDAWWKDELSSNQLENLNKLSLSNWKGRSAFIIATKYKIDPCFIWLWKVGIGDSKKAVFSAVESEYFTPAFKYASSTPLLLGNGNDALELISEGLDVSNFINSEIPIYLDKFSFTKDRELILRLSVGSDQETITLFEDTPLLENAELRQISFEVWKWWKPTPKTVFTFYGRIDLFGTTFSVKFSPGRLVAGKIAEGSSIKLGEIVENIGGFELPLGLGSLQLTEAEIDKNFEEKRLLVALGIKGSLKLIDELLELNYVKFSVQKFEDPQKTNLAFDAYAKIFDTVILGIRGIQSSNGWRLFMKASPNSTCTLGHIVSKLDSGVVLPEAIRNLGFGDFSAEFDTGAKHLSLDAAINWEIPINSENTALNFSVFFYRDANDWTFSFEAILKDLSLVDVANAIARELGGTVELPTSIGDLSVEKLFLEITKEKVSFSCNSKLNIGEEEVDLFVSIEKENREEAKELTVAGFIAVDDLELKLIFNKNQQPEGISDEYVIGALSYGKELDIRKLIQKIAPDIANSVPISFPITLEELLLVMHSEKSRTSPSKKKEYLFRLSFKLEFHLSGFPLIGKMLKEIKFTDGQLLAANKDWKNESIQQVNDLLEFIGEGTSATPPKPIAQPEQASDTAGLAQGISLGGTFQITEAIRFPLFLNFGGSSEASTSGTSDENRDQVTQEQPGQQVEKPKITPDEEPPTKAVSKPDERSQSKVGKVISAVRIQKVGLIFEKGRLGLKITGGLALATFEFELIGLQVTVPQDVLSNPKLLIENNPAEILEFSLDGFGAKIQKGTLSIMGAFMRIEHDTYEEYAGVIQVSLAKFSLAGMGSYAEFPNNVPKEERHTSLFLFVALGFPIPIHPSLLIEGMCLGFGIHRDFIPPKMDEILTYPLVQLSITPPPPIEISELLNSIGQYFPPTADQYFVVAGIKFKAFGIVKTLAMLAVKFGREFEINLIGVSSIEFPPSLFIELGWQARFVPAAGYLFIGGQLTSRSYLLIPEVHITGGFAVAVWMGAEHHGDFVVSVGGYHPQFNVPDHYPDHIPRLGISFELSPLTIKGGVYFAVTPKCLMMGGFLEASLDQGWIEAYLKIHMDAIIYFEPFHYDIRMGVEAGVTATIGSGYLSYDLNLHLNIDVHLWGPEFSGTASIDVGPKTFELEFGEGNTPKALPLHWDEFEKKFLKTADKDGNLNPSVCTVSVTKGLLRKVKEGGIEYHVIDPKQVEVEMKSLVPLASENHPSLGITPMDVRHGGYTAQMTVRGIQNFDSDEIKDSVPSGIWGGKGLVQANIGSSDSGLVKDVMTGKKLIPKKDEETTETHEISKEGLSFNIDEFDLHDKSVKYQFKKLENTSYESPFDKFSDFTGFADIEIEPFDKEELLKSAVLCYELA